MTRMLVHAGANRGLLLKIADGKLEAEASAWTEGDSVRVSTINPDRYGLSPPYSVIDRALQTRTPFVISAPTSEPGPPTNNPPPDARSSACRFCAVAN